ncbi:hypothetical protein TKK_0005706 [Trichogramma kaykai]
MKQTNHEATSSQESDDVRTDAHAKSRSLNGILKTTIEHLRLCKTLVLPSREIIPGSLDERTETAVHLEPRDGLRDHGAPDRFAVPVGNLEMVREFVVNGVDVDLACRNLPRTPLNTTVYFDQAEGEDDRVSILELLLREGASPNELFKDGKSPLHCLCYTFLESEGSARDDKLKMIELLLWYECDVNTTDTFGSSPIFSLFRDFTTKDTDQVKVLEILLDHGADLKAVDSSGHTILHRIIRPNLPEYCEVDNYEKLFNDDIGAEVVALLLKHGIDVNVKDIMGRTPLQIAVSNLNSDVVKLLLDHGADLSGIAIEGGYFDHDFLPTLEMTQNLLDIIQLLEIKGYSMDMKKRLQVLTFLVGSNQFLCNLRTIHLLDYNFCSLEHWIESEEGVNRYFAPVVLGDLYTSNPIYTFSDHIDDFNAIDEVQKELEVIASIMITKHISLLDLCKTSPDKIYKTIANSEYVSKVNWINLNNDFPYMAEFIKGQINRCLITAYCRDVATELLSFLSPIRMPELCIENIVKYFNNDNILYLCRTIMNEE